MSDRELRRELELMGSARCGAHQALLERMRREHRGDDWQWDD